VKRDHYMQALIDAPLANATKLNSPGGRRSAPRKSAPQYEDEIGCPKVSQKELRARKKAAEQAKYAALYDYYAQTDLTPDRVAQHMGLYRNEQTGVDDKGKPVFARVLNVKLAADELGWRRKAAA
jgi:hypothetical protein